MSWVAFRTWLGLLWALLAIGVVWVLGVAWAIHKRARGS